MQASQRPTAPLAEHRSPGNVDPPLDLRQRMHLSDQPAKIPMRSPADHPPAKDAAQKHPHHTVMPNRAVKLRQWTALGLLRLRARGTTLRAIRTMSRTSLLLLLLLLEPTPRTRPVRSPSSPRKACTSPPPTAHTSTSGTSRRCRTTRGLGRHRQGATARRSLPISGVRFDKPASGPAHTLLPLLILRNSNGIRPGNVVLPSTSL